MTGKPESNSLRLERAGRLHFGNGWTPRATVRAPGRIEVIGNHIDYNGGPVLAAAIDREIWIAAAPGSTADIRVVFSDQVEPGPFDVIPANLEDWRLEKGEPTPKDYLCGVIASLVARGYPVRSDLDIVVAGNLPPGLGISSSAALCVGLALSLASTRPPDRELVLIAQEAEHRVGSPCGTMDQSASVAGGLIAYSGADDSVEPVETALGELRFVVINSGIERNLATSSYPDRVRESQTALTTLRKELNPGLRFLADIATEDLPAISALFARRSEISLAKRVRHIVAESDRVRRAIAAVRHADWALVGELMTHSGESSSRDYEISHPAVDEIVRLSLEVNGVHGARMMGGGEGGAALALVRRDAILHLERALDQSYFGKNGLSELNPKVVACTFALGAGIVEDLP